MRELILYCREHTDLFLSVDPMVLEDGLRVQGVKIMPSEQWTRRAGDYSKRPGLPKELNP